MERRKRRRIVQTIIAKCKDLIYLHCPECSGIMKSEMLDMEFDLIVYKCQKCGKEWV